MVEMSEFCKKLKNKKLSFYIVRSMNTNCVNRDENNDVKTTVVEGKRTQYISSQCIKRNIREEWRNQKYNIGKKIFQSDQKECFTNMLKPYNYTGTDKGAVLTKKLLETFAGVGGNKKDKKDIIVHFSETKIKKLIVEILNVPGINGNLNNCDTAFTPEDFGKLFDDLYNKISCPLDTDIQMFGTFLASNIKETTEGALCNSMAYSLTPSVIEGDFFTANQDDEIFTGVERISLTPTGAVHMGETSIQKNSNMYFFFTIDMNTLMKNLNYDDEAIKKCLSFDCIKHIITFGFYAHKHQYYSNTLPIYISLILSENEAYDIPSFIVEPTATKDKIVDKVDERVNHIFNNLDSSNTSMVKYCNTGAEQLDTMTKAIVRKSNLLLINYLLLMN